MIFNNCSFKNLNIEIGIIMANFSLDLSYLTLELNLITVRENKIWSGKVRAKLGFCSNPVLGKFWIVSKRTLFKKVLRICEDINWMFG